jgi:hypothetical protein
MQKSLKAQDENSAALSIQVDWIQCLGLCDFNLISWALILTKAWFCVNRKDTWDHRVGASERSRWWLDWTTNISLNYFKVFKWLNSNVKMWWP